MRALALLALSLPLLAADALHVAKQLKQDEALNTDPESSLWKSAPAVVAENNAKGEPTPGHRTEIRARWTGQHLYFLFICSYEELFGNSNPSTATETNRLWEKDAAEIFIGGDFQKIWQYREYQVSPQGEWVDLDIDRKAPLPEGGWKWNSGFTVAARIEPKRKMWYGAFKIPIASINEGAAKLGREYRVNYYRFQGPGPKRSNIAWRPTGPTGNHHIPEAFGILRLEK